MGDTENMFLKLSVNTINSSCRICTLDIFRCPVLSDTMFQT